jgi:lactate 2-monooxygenase
VSRKWADLPFLRKVWGDGPIILKGIQTVTDASRAVEAGMDGIWVSNHGGRQVDGAIGSLQALVPIARYVKSLKNGPIIVFDSGIRSGADIMKALGEIVHRSSQNCCESSADCSPLLSALGADLVGIGRPWAWGLAINGQVGVEQVLKSLLADLELNCALAGIQSIDELTPQMLVQAGKESHM